MNDIEQMDKSKPDCTDAERIHSRKKLYAMLTACVMFILACSTIALCFSTCNREDSGTHNPLMRKYQNLSEDILDEDDADLDVIIDFIHTWQELNEQVFGIKQGEAADSVCHVYIGEFIDLNDTIRTRLKAAIDSKPRNLQDVLRIKRATNPFRNDTTLARCAAEAHVFFDELGCDIHKNDDSTEALQRYREYMKSMSEKEIHTSEEFYRFLKSEDVLFRSFLAHLSDYANTSISDITTNTENVCKHIFRAANAGDLNTEEVMAFMAVRTNRRLLMNARVGMDVLSNGSITSELQMAVYCLMVLQPFMAIDNCALALLTDSETHQLEQLAGEIQRFMDVGKHSSAKLRYLSEELPNYILKHYIDTL